jgi:hypothetical protein
MSDPNFQQFFPVTPNDMSWEDWNGNFILYYGQEPIAYHPEEEWQIAATQIASLPTFSLYPIPMPDSYETWQEWAIEVTEIINGKSR